VSAGGGVRDAGEGVLGREAEGVGWSSEGEGRSVHGERELFVTKNKKKWRSYTLTSCSGVSRSRHE
jgi:hypothetical protein